MEITRDLIESLTADDLKEIEQLSKLLTEAKQAVEIVRSYYTFRIGEERVTLWHDNNNGEYLTRDGVWQARYLHQTYDVPCTVDGVFEAFKEARGKTHGEVTAAQYFRSFINRTKKMIDKEKGND